MHSVQEVVQQTTRREYYTPHIKGDITLDVNITNMENLGSGFE